MLTKGRTRQDTTRKIIENIIIGIKALYHHIEIGLIHFPVIKD